MNAGESSAELYLTAEENQRSRADIKGRTEVRAEAQRVWAN